MASRRWMDPRDDRIWTVSAGPVRRLGGGDSTPTLAFRSQGTPPSLLRAPCSEAAERSLDALDDQHLALCLDAARRGARLWIHPQRPEIWSVEADGENGVRALVLRSAGREVRVERAWDGEAIPEEEMVSLVEGSRV